MKIEIWFDYQCPYCYMGERKFQLGLANFAHKDVVEIAHKCFQLDPYASKEKYGGRNINQLIADKYNMSLDEAKKQNNKIINAAAEVGLNYRFDLLKLNNTELAHQVTKYAQSLNREGLLIESIYNGYFEKGLDIGDVTQLLKIAEELSFDIDDLKDQLENGSLKKMVEEDRVLSSSLKISGVPFFVVDNKYAVSGAQSPEYFTQVLSEIYEKIN